MGVLALDNNEVDNAIALFKEAVSIDPYYQQAKSNLKSSEVQVSGGLLFASALNLNDKKEKQRDALKLIYDTFIDNYLMVQISGQESVSDMDDPNNVFIEIEFTITQNINVATKFTKDIKNISEGDEPIFDTSWYSWLNSFLFPDDFWLIKSIRKDFKKNNSYNLYKENFDWIREQYIRRPSGITPTSFKKDYRINFLNNNGVFNEQYIYTSLEGGCTSCWRDGWEDVKNDFFYKHYIINLDSNLPPSPKSSSANKYPSKLYLYFKMPLKDVQTITSISIEAVD